MPPIDLSFLGTGLSPTGTTSSLPGEGFIDDPGADLVRALLSQLEVARPQPPPRLPIAANILGALGDALMAAATVRAGGTPPALGPFGARVAQGRERFRMESAAAETETRELRNKIRIAQFGREQEQAGARELAQIRASSRPLRLIPTTVDVGGVPTRMVDVFDPVDGERLGRFDLGEAGFTAGIIPGTAGGEEGIFRIPRRPGAPAERVTVGGRPAPEPLRPPAKPGVVESISDLTNVIRKIDAVKAHPLVKPTGTGQFIRDVGKEVGRRVPIIGPRVLERSDPQAADLANGLDDIRARVQLILTGKAVNQQEIQRLTALIPGIATAGDPELFRQQLDRFRQEFASTLRRQAGLRKDLFRPEELEDIGAVEAEAGVPRRKSAAELADEMGL